MKIPKIWVCVKPLCEFSFWIVLVFQINIKIIFIVIYEMRKSWILRKYSSVNILFALIVRFWRWIIFGVLKINILFNIYWNFWKSKFWFLRIYSWGNILFEISLSLKDKYFLWKNFYLVRVFDIYIYRLSVWDTCTT